MRPLRMLPLAAALCAFALAAVAGDKPRGGGSVEIRVGQERKAEGGDLRISFERVAEDSRCPEGVVCVWAGNARLSLRLSTWSGASRRVTLNTATQPTRVSFRGRTLRIVEVRPPRREGQSTGQRDYRVTLEVSR